MVGIAVRFRAVRGRRRAGVDGGAPFPWPQVHCAKVSVQPRTQERREKPPGALSRGPWGALQGIPQKLSPTTHYLIVPTVCVHILHRV